MDRDKIRDWIDEKKKAGEDPEVIIDALLDKGFDDKELLKYVKDKGDSDEDFIDSEESEGNLLDNVKLGDLEKRPEFDNYYKPLGLIFLVLLSLSFGFLLTGEEDEFTNLNKQECYSEDLEIVESDTYFISFEDQFERNEITGEPLNIIEEELDDSVEIFEHYQTNFTLTGDFSGEENLVFELGNNAERRSSTDVFYQSYSGLEEDARLDLDFEIDFRPGYVEVWRAGCRGEVASESF